MIETLGNICNVTNRYLLEANTRANCDPASGSHCCEPTEYLIHTWSLFERYIKGRCNVSRAHKSRYGNGPKIRFEPESQKALSNWATDILKQKILILAIS